MKRLLILAAAFACSLPAFAFNANQTVPQIDAEVAARINAKQSLEFIAEQAKNAGVQVDPLSLALVKYGSYDAVLVGLLKAGYDAGQVVSALIARGADPKVMTTTALANGADPGKVTAATAAGTPAAGTPPPALAGFTGFTGNTFSRAATVSGSGTSTSVSKS